MTTVTVPSLNKSTKQQNSIWVLLVLIIIVGFLLRLPYWKIIPAPDDELYQSIVALEIANGTHFPLVGNDSYAGPFYFYFLAFLMKLGLTGPLIGRVIAIVTGTLTIPLTYLWVQALGKNKIAALITAVLVAINPYLIVINSHMGGTTYLLPFLSVLFFWCLTLTINRDSRGWLVVTAIAAGLVMQVNPVGALVLLGGWIWGAWQMHELSKLGKYWPTWPILLGIGIILIYSPVIIYNLGTNLDSVAEVQERSYLWEATPTVQTFINNMRRLSLQLFRQSGGVLRGNENFAALLGVPLLYLILSLWGFFFTTRKISPLPILLTLPFFIVFPYFSSHYGFSIVTRFTTLLIPVFTAVIGFLLANWLRRITQNQPPQKYWHSIILLIIGLALIIAPLLSMQQYYNYILRENRSGKVLLDITEEIVAQNQGEPVYISTYDQINVKGRITQLPHNYFIFANIHHEYLPAEQMIGRLYAHPGPATFLISDHDAAIISQIVPLIPSTSQANQAANAKSFGLYTLDSTVDIAKPEFVISPAEIPENIDPTAVLGQGLQLLGCAQPIIQNGAETLNIVCYWQLIAPMPEKTYVAFAHLVDNETSTLVSQDDHILGQEKYPLTAWQADEIIIENYSLPTTDLADSGPYTLLLGVYSWPELVRLEVSGQPENTIALPPIQIE